MTDHNELIKALRICTDADVPCDECPFLKSCLIDNNDGVTGLMLKAADAIEELQAQVNAFNFIRPIQMPLPQPPKEETE